MIIIIIIGCGITIISIISIIIIISCCYGVLRDVQHHDAVPRGGPRRGPRGAAPRYSNICIYIYICNSLSLSLYIYMLYVCIYIYIYMYIVIMYE